MTDLSIEVRAYDRTAYKIPIRRLASVTDRGDHHEEWVVSKNCEVSAIVDESGPLHGFDNEAHYLTIVVDPNGHSVIGTWVVD